MRLVNTESFHVESFLDNEIASQYAFLSHTWEREEVTLSDMQAGRENQMHGYHKIKQACKIARQHRFSHIWIDTCCIGETSSSEPCEAINSMFQYYAGVDVCYAYLEDFTASNTDEDHNSMFSSCKWFTR
jgi:Heterokaryon incompatibility protein (HET)